MEGELPDYLKHALPLLSFASFRFRFECPTDGHTGHAFEASLCASRFLSAVRFPKAVGIAASVVLRFFPTISGEYRAIRSSQRFRGIGVGVVHTLTHLPSTVEYILIPLILRTTKVAEELSASMTVRGVRFSGETISYRPIHFSRKDGALCVFMVLIASAVFVLEKGGIL